VRVSASAVSPLGQDELWNLIVRWEDQAAWLRDADAIRVLTSHREGVGVRVAVRTRVLGIPLFTEELEVTLWQPPRRLVVGHRSFVRGRGTWTLSSEATGTRITWVEELSLPVPVLGELALLVYRPVMRRLMRGSLAGLRARAPG
jgi:hypothetical protein